MGKRTKFEDIASMALIYTNRATGNKMISYDKVEKFDKIINENLDNMNSKINPSLFYDEESKLYFHANDENGKLYLVIDPSVDIKVAQDYHIGCLPIDIVVASQMENALNIIGLQLVDGVLVKKKETNSNLTLDEVIEKVLENPRDFFIKVANTLFIEELDYLKLLIENKSCANCSNGICKVETIEKSCNDICVAWDNKELIGKQKILAKND